MRPITINVAATGPTFTTNPVVLDPYTNPQSVSVIVNTPTNGGSGTVAMQVSNDDPFAPNFTPAGASWVAATGAFSNGGAVTPTQPVSTVMVSIPRMIRFVASACVGNPNVFFKIVQGGLGGV